ncbi:von Willebrand factor type A domain-containing protein [Roseivivax lentus]|uniref:von Willebrand factor type A domain-containing protein n=1 Tax=Roseivivax lentus TaxID=633194 RepID=A0A1N7P3E6_9RHOB|nr:S8 family serine peptidase [Roseivivax lentus]SIT05078.1 von Willebrand factor type A domain-containing protein [Roseivivax lentus]
MTYLSHPRFAALLCCLTLIPAHALAQDSFADLREPPRNLAELFQQVEDTETLDLDEAVARRIETRAEFGGEARAHVLVRLAEPLTGILRDRLAEQGLEIIDRFDADIWIARTDRAGADLLDQSEDISAAAIIPAAAKVSPLISLETPFDWQRRDGSEELGYSILFHKGVTADEAVGTLSDVAELEIDRVDPLGFSYVRSLTVPLTADELLSVANLDIVQFIEPEAAPVIDNNRNNTQPLSNVDDVQVAPYNLSGAGVTVGVWEANDVVRATHVDLTPRVTVQPGQTASQDGHALHVTGTIGASGVNNPAAEGMAPAVTILSWDAASDAAEMAVAAAPGAANRIVASNHSYGIGIGWDNAGLVFGSQAAFGSYTNLSVGFDQVIAGDGVSVPATDLVVLKSAGNDRNDGPGAGPNPDDCNQGSAAFDADCLGPRASAKNPITVGAMNGGALIANFSSFGPTDDGRLKPDLVANGTNVLSLGDATGPQTDTGTFTTQGTSMSTPAVTGIVALLFEEIADQGLPLPSAAAIKAILIQTARDVAGTGQAQVGPDFATGWGIADAQAAVDLLRRPGGPGFAEGTLTATGAGGAWEFPFVVPAGEPEMHVTLAWMDLPGTPTGAGPELVNDLDLRLIPPGGGAAVNPWTLNPANPIQAAVRNGGDDALNPVEQVSVLNPAAGTWLARVTAKPGSLALGAQRFAIAGPITPDTGPIAGPKANIMMVLDKSGSMILPSATTGLTKMAAMQNAARAFVDYMSLVGGHNLGVTAFDSAVASTVPVVGLQSLDATSAGNARTAIGNLSAGGFTNIIDGVDDAVGQLAGPNATNSDDVVVLFSDGRHNRPTGSDVTAIDTLMADPTRFFSIGYGTDVDSTVLPGVAANHDGVHLEEQGLQAGQLAKLFMVVGGLAADETIIVDPDYPMPPGGRADQNILATKADRAITFATFWNEPQARKIALQLFGPAKDCRVPMDQHEGFDMATGTGYALVRIELPYACIAGNEDQVMHEGTWRLSMRNTGATDDVAKVVVLSDSGVTLRSDSKAGGGKALLTARLVEGGELLRKGVRIFANIRPNRPSSGDSEKLDAITDGRFDPDRPVRGRDRITGGGLLASPTITVQPGRLRGTMDSADPMADMPEDQMLSIDPRLSINEDVLGLLRGRAAELQLSPELLAQLQGRFRIPPQPTGIELLDDGTNGDAQANDGIFSVMVAVPQPGLYQTHIRATQARPEGLMTREALGSFVSN